jgi:hypothetical protein
MEFSVTNDGSDFDVYVSDGVLVEVQRGRALTMARSFTVDYDGPIQQMVHGEVMTPSSSHTVTPSPCPPTRRDRLIAWIVFAAVFVLGALVGLAMANVLRKW